jgi:hypothetical protein
MAAMENKGKTTTLQSNEMEKSMAYHTSMVMPFGPLSVPGLCLCAQRREVLMECNVMKGNAAPLRECRAP